MTETPWLAAMDTAHECAECGTQLLKGQLCATIEEVGLATYHHMEGECPPDPQEGSMTSTTTTDLTVEAIARAIAGGASSDAKIGEAVGATRQRVQKFRKQYQAEVDEMVESIRQDEADAASELAAEAASERGVDEAEILGQAPAAARPIDDAVASSHRAAKLMRKRVEGLLADGKVSKRARQWARDFVGGTPLTEIANAAGVGVDTIKAAITGQAEPSASGATGSRAASTGQRAAVDKQARSDALVAAFEKGGVQAANAAGLAGGEWGPPIKPARTREILIERDVWVVGERKAGAANPKRQTLAGRILDDADRSKVGDARHEAGVLLANDLEALGALTKLWDEVKSKVTVGGSRDELVVAIRRAVAGTIRPYTDKGRRAQ